MNLVNYETTGLKEAYDAVRKEAERLGIEIAGTEIVGLVPEAALDTSSEYFARLEDFGADAVIEHRIKAREPGRRAKD